MCLPYNSNSEEAGTGRYSHPRPGFLICHTSLINEYQASERGKKSSQCPRLSFGHRTETVKYMRTRKRGRIREQKAIGKKGYKQNSNVSTYSLHSPDIIYHCILVCLSSYKSKYFGLHINLTGSSISGLTIYILKRIAAQIFPNSLLY